MSPSLREHLEAQFRRATIASNDLREAFQFAETAAATEEWIVREGLLQAAVVSYARAFVASEGGGESSTALPGSFLREFSPEEREAHDRILRVRHSVVAHSDYETNRVSELSISPGGYSLSLGRDNVRFHVGGVGPLRTQCWRAYLLSQLHGNDLVARIRALAT